jgi:hypothetical protein
MPFHDGFQVTYFPKFTFGNDGGRKAETLGIKLGLCYVIAVCFGTNCLSFLDIFPPL